MQRSPFFACLTRTRICVAWATRVTRNNADNNNIGSHSSNDEMEGISTTTEAAKAQGNNSSSSTPSTSLISDTKNENSFSTADGGGSLADKDSSQSASGSQTKNNEKMTSTITPLHNAESAKVLSFTKITVQPWQKLMIDNVNYRDTVPSTLLFFGKELGPRPLFILDHCLPDPIMKLTSQLDNTAKTGSEDEKIGKYDNSNRNGSFTANAAMNEEWDKDVMLTHAAHKYEPMLSHLSWPYGVIYIPLWLDAASLHVPHLLYDTCRMINATLDAFDVRWSHFLTHSYGALIAARLAASRFFLHRIGTLISLDSPLITETAVRNATLREEIHAAEEDVNVPQSELVFAQEQLMSNLETAFPCAAKDYDQLLFDKYFFNPECNFSRNGLDYDEHRYVPVRELRHLHHPMQFITPSSKPVMDSKAHKEFFQLRRIATIKTASEHNDLFAPSAAKEVAGVIDTWLRRFEPDEIILRRYNQAAKELSELLNSDSSNLQKNDGQPKVEVQPRKKKEKKKKVM